MRHYEIVFLVHPDQSDQIQRMLERYRAMVTETDGAVHRLEEWGRRQLAYPIQKLSKAFYVLMNIECTPETLAKLEESLHFNDAILRWLVIRRKAAITEESPIMKMKEKTKGRPPEQDSAAAADDAGGDDAEAPDAGDDDPGDGEAEALGAADGDSDDDDSDAADTPPQPDQSDTDGEKSS